MAGVNHHEIVSLLKLLPKTEFAFYYNHVSRKTSGSRLIVAVNDLKEFHKENIKNNKTHYPYTARVFKEKLIAFFSKYGARIHFNQFKIENDKIMTYGVIKKQDLIQDLKLWETLWVSSFMMRPVTYLHKNPDIQIAHQNNLRSACAYAALLTKNGAWEVEFYKNIVSIPHYQTYSKLFRLIDREDPEDIVTTQLEQFREIYEPIVKNTFDDSIFLADGKFGKDETSSVTKYLLSNMNDNVHQNLFKAVSPLKYDTDKKFHKKTMNRKAIYEGIDEYLSKQDHENLNQKLTRAVDKILLAHRNSKIFLVLMSGPFLISFYIFKYMLKIILIYYIFKKPAKDKEGEKNDKSESSPKVVQN